MKFVHFCGCMTLALVWHGLVRGEEASGEQKPAPVQFCFPQGPARPESPLHVYGGGPLKFALDVEAPLGTRAQIVADLFQLAGGGVAAPLQRDVPVAAALSFEDRTRLTVDCLLPSLPAVRRKTTMLLRLKTAVPSGSPVNRSVALIVYPAAEPGAWAKTVAARLERSGLRRLAVFGEGTALRGFLRSRKVAFDDLGEHWPDGPDVQTLYLGDTRRLPTMRFDDLPGVRIVLFLPHTDEQSLPAGIYRSFDAKGGTLLKVTLPGPLATSGDDPAAQDTLDEILRLALEPRGNPATTTP